MKNYLLGIDIGTSACKVAVFDILGRVVAQATEEYKVYYPQQDYVEQNPMEWWESVCDATKKVLVTIDANDIAGVGVDGQSWSALPVDKNGNALHNAMIWMDRRSGKQAQQTIDNIGNDEIFNLCGNPLDATYTTPKILWLKENKPEVYKDTYKFLQCNSYITYMLTGEITQDISQGYGLHFFDMKNGTWNGSMADEIGIDIAKMPNIFNCHDVVGTITKKAHEECGLAIGTPVVAGGLDAACGTLGAGVVNVGQTQEQGGQAGGMSICEDTPIADKSLILSYHVIPNLWLLQGGTVGGGSFKWLRSILGDIDFKDMDNEGENVDAGSDGLIFLPYMAGERSPIWDKDAKGIYYGLGYDKTRAHIIRATLEGCAFALQHNLKTAEVAGVNVGELLAMGGAANSRLWTQIKADVTGKVIKVPSSDTATTLGAAILAGVGTGVYKDFNQAVDSTIKVTRTHEPNMQNHEKYKHSYEKYLEIYLKLKDTFRRG